VLRGIEKSELPRLVTLLNVWDIAQWLVVLPYPYTMQHAEEFYADMDLAEASGEPQFYGISLKSNSLLMGGVGLHPPRGTSAIKGDVEVGYWLGRDFWGHGFMNEAVQKVAAIGFSRPATNALIATTSPENVASQNVLQKLGMKNLGVMLRDYSALRGDEKVVKWQVTRQEWKAPRDL